MSSGTKRPEERYFKRKPIQTQKSTLVRIMPASRPQSAVHGDIQHSNDGESCRSCLYTGLATCTGLSGYFLYLAMEEELHRTSKPNTLQSTIVNFMRGNPVPKQNRPFLFAMSAAWFVAGSYRLYLS